LVENIAREVRFVPELEDAGAGVEEGSGGGEEAESAKGEQVGIEDGVEGGELQGPSYKIAGRILAQNRFASALSEVSGNNKEIRRC
jgi:hypothetical protein